MRKLITGLAASVLAAATPLAAQTTVIHADGVVTDADSAPLGRSTVTVTDGRIVSIVDGWQAVPEGAEMVHLEGKTLVPGLIDLHTHLSGDPSGEFWRAAVQPPEWYSLVAAKNARVTAKAGFTTVRDLGARSDQVMQSLRRATAEGMLPGPRIVTSARTIAIVGGHGDINGFRREVNDALGTSFACTGATECAEKVRLASKYGADLIKITATGGVLSQQGRGLEAHFTFDEMKTIVDTAHSLGLKTAAHAHGARGIELAARAGVQTIEHGTYIDEQAAKVMRENGTILVPTLMAFQGIKENLGKGFYTPVVEDKIRAVSAYAETIVERARKWGVTMAFGTDAGVFPHGDNAGELALMRKGGMSDAQVLASATTGAAKVLGMENEIGRIAPGFSADMVAVDGNPLDDVSVLEDTGWVMVRGRVIE
ncbi:amidohydrolase family protein [Erythrobacter aquimaris]|uniref:Amidohydrolase family protein n=1 Tax=Qipengyuania aquimaris TaxID=255984 RepID=A0A6I4TFK5_9SPHN|nr:amidohydrolase family protein [Qipengyuania aquimaris]MCA0903919.1 amidohydrolase family protein [Qipengyuania aquimaris]MXO94872.1 amidohydrolase family protein [Qipengyuania aquimaris]